MKKITYGAPGLVDWVAQIKAGSATLRVHFTGGALTSYGVTPAEYTTDNPFIQRVIENSAYFKENRIIIQRQTEIEEPKQPAFNNKPKSQSAPLPAPAPQPKAEVPVAEAPAPPAPVEAEAQTEESGAAGLAKVEVTCLPDAQAYIQENFNISSYKVRSCEIAQRIAAEHGIQFTGGKFDALNDNKNNEDKAWKE